ncbi:unannotated protein [freshwater metagenome]|uniref:Unannotated protein n=1 Tax=freshwater metagenome TaxID=449393 RepID=A0A6J7H1C3_9ZZZZ
MNPLAPLIVATTLGLVVLVSFDPVTTILALAFEVIGLFFLRITVRRATQVVVIVLISAVFGALATALYGRPSGDTIALWGPVHITTGSIDLALLVGLRIVAIALPGAIYFAATNVTALSDALTQIARLPSRFMAGALSSLRMMTLLSDDWRAMGRARRARGLSAGTPQSFAGQSFSLFVRAVRRGSTLATTMEARGFGGEHPRSQSRVSLWRVRDSVTVLTGFAAAAATVCISVAMGSWQVVVFG